MADKYSTIQQHQPLRVPQSFDSSGKALVLQLDEIFDDIYKRFGRLRVADLGEKLQDLILIEDENGNYVSVKATIDGVVTDIQDKFGNYYTKSETASAITSAMSDALGNYYTKSETASAISTSLSTALGNYYTKSETASQISTTIGTALGDYYTKSETANAISTSISSSLGNYYTKSETASAISTQMSTALGDYYTKTETASKISSSITNALGDYSTSEQMADAITAAVGDCYGRVSGITINSSGVEITGSKYLKLTSGGSIDVATANITIDSENGYFATKEHIALNPTASSTPSYAIELGGRRYTEGSNGCKTDFALYRTAGNSYMSYGYIARVGIYDGSLGINEYGEIAFSDSSCNIIMPSTSIDTAVARLGIFPSANNTTGVALGCNKYPWKYGRFQYLRVESALSVDEELGAKKIYAKTNMYVNGNAVIHAGNIGSQSVDYASSANVAASASYASSAGSVAWGNVSSKPATATRWPNWGEITGSGAENLGQGTADFTDGTEVFSSYASNNGFSDSNAKGVVYRRSALHMYNYVKSKASGTWGIAISGNAATATTAASCSGNAATASYATEAGSASSAGNSTALKDKTNTTSTYANYGASALAGSSISYLTCWNGYELRAISKAETFNVVRDNGGDTRWRANGSPTSGAWFSGTPLIGSDGVMEIGKYIDFHASKTTTADYDARITATTSGLTLSGTTTGTFSGNLTGTASATSDSRLSNILRTLHLVSPGSSSNKVTFTLEDGKSFIGTVASGTVTIFRTGSTLYSNGFTSGFSASLSGNTVTITRSTSTVFVVNGICVG